VGVTISLETSSLETPLARDLADILLVVSSTDGAERSSSGRHGGLPTLGHVAALLLALGGLHRSTGRLLVASLNVWFCMAISSAVRDIMSTALAASISSEDLSCNGPLRGFQHD
jgi:hypothetical protein